MFPNVFKYLSIGLLLSSLSLGATSLWYYSQYKSVMVDNVTLSSNNQILKDSIDKQHQLIASLREDQELLNESIKALSLSQNTIFTEYNKNLNELSLLRATEAKNALENPYKTGNAANVRILKRLQHIATGNSHSN